MLRFALQQNVRHGWDAYLHVLELLKCALRCFAPLGIVLVGMLGIGIAERTGFIGSALKAMLMVVPQKLLVSILGPRPTPSPTPSRPVRG